MREFLRANAAAAEKHVDRYCAEAKRLGSIKALEQAPKTRSRDAAMFFAGRADWEEGRIGALHLPSSLVERMGAPPRNWRTFTEADYASLDFGWMRELLQYDHWSLTAAGPLKDGAFTNFLEAPLPWFVTLQQWVKLRLVKGRQEGDLAQASLEVRYLADLCASTGSFVGEMIRAAMYGIERGFIEDQGLAAPQGQPPVPSAGDVQLLRRTGHIGMRMLYPGVPRAVKEKALACNPVMRCSTLIEGMAVTASMRDLVPDAAGDLDWLAAQSPCDPALAELVRKSPAAPAPTLQNYFKDTEGIEEHLCELLGGGL